MTSRRVDEAPSFALIENKKELLQIEMEIKKILPKTEVTVEGLPHVSVGKIIDWDPVRKLFTVKWKEKSDEFEAKTESETGLRAFFKCSLFSTQLVFKTSTVRRLEDGSYHYRIPLQLFKQQKRGALRVPISANTATLHAKEGDFEIVDLSIGGAKLKNLPALAPTSILTGCRLSLNGHKIRVPEFGAKVTRRDKDFIACKFTELPESVKAEIKHFLIEALRIYYEEIL